MVLTFTNLSEWLSLSLSLPFLMSKWRCQYHLFPKPLVRVNV